jgi:hypothetical protein
MSRSNELISVTVEAIRVTVTKVSQMPNVREPGCRVKSSICFTTFQRSGHYSLKPVNPIRVDANPVE